MNLRPLATEHGTQVTRQEPPLTAKPPGSAPGPGFVFDDGAAYELVMGRWSALVAEPFLHWLALPEELAWLDIGCGDGSFTEQLVRRQAPMSVVGVDPAPAQLDFARQRTGTSHVRFLVGDALALPVPAASADAAVMALVLFFVPDPLRSVHELMRVTRRGGTLAAYHWDMEGGGFPLQPIIDAARADGYKPHQPPSAWAATLQSSQALWREAGATEVETCQLEVARGFDSFDSYWHTAQANPRMRDLFASLSPAGLQRLSERVRERLGASDDRPLVCTARANAVKGRRP